MAVSVELSRGPVVSALLEHDIFRLFPVQPTDTYFTNWNTVIADEVTAHGQTLADMHTYFYGHGFQSSPDWYFTDCIHPSQIGHDKLRHLVYQEITGEALP